MRKLFMAVTVALLVWAQVSSVSPAQAHIGGGPPFLSVNGKDAPTNPSYIQSTQNFTVEQDLPVDHYLVNQPIHFAIRLDRLPVPPDVAANSTFRWTWDTNSTTHDFGNKIDHTYKSIGSHIMTLEVKGPGETDYLVYDTVRLDVVPSLSYQAPSVDIAVVKDKFAATKPIKFVAQTHVDPSAKVKLITWDFGTDEGISHEVSPVHTYKEQDYLHFVYVELIDSNGFKVENGITLTANSGALTVSPLTSNGPAVSLVEANSMGSSRAKNASSLNPWLMWGLIAGILVISVAGLAFFSNRQRKATQRVMRW